MLKDEHKRNRDKPGLTVVVGAGVGVAVALEAVEGAVDAGAVDFTGVGAAVVCFEAGVLACFLISCWILSASVLMSWSSYGDQSTTPNTPIFSIE